MSSDKIAGQLTKKRRTMRLRWYLPKFGKVLGYEPNNHNTNERIEERTDLLAKLLALYPFTDTEQLAKEFMLNHKFVNQLARFYGVFKTKEARSQIAKQNGDNPRSRQALFFKKHILNKHNNKQDNG